MQQEPIAAAEQPVQQKEKIEEVFEDSFGEIPDILLPSIQRPLRGKLRVVREEDADEEREEVEEMPPKDILRELEMRKKKRQEAEKARAAAKSGPSVGGPGAKTSRPTGSKVPPPPSPGLQLVRGPGSTTSQSKEVPKDTPVEKRQKTTATGSGGEVEKGKGAAGSAPAWRPQFVTPEKRQITSEDSLAADPSIARTLYHGLALPKDVTLPESLKLAIDDHYFHLGQICFTF